MNAKTTQEKTPSQVYKPFELVKPDCTIDYSDDDFILAWKGV